MISGMGDVISALLSSERAWNRHSRSPQASSAPVPAFAGLTGTERRGQLAGKEARESSARKSRTTIRVGFLMAPLGCGAATDSCATDW